MSPQRRLLLAVVAVQAALAAAALVVPQLRDETIAPAAAAPQDQPGPVLPFPAYGGSTAGLELLARRLRPADREAVVVPRRPGTAPVTCAGRERHRRATVTGAR